MIDIHEIIRAHKGGNSQNLTRTIHNLLKSCVGISVISWHGAFACEIDSSFLYKYKYHETLYFMTGESKNNKAVAELGFSEYEIENLPPNFIKNSGRNRLFIPCEDLTKTDIKNPLIEWEADQ